MNARLAKEFHPLLLPLGLGAAAATALAVITAFNRALPHEDYLSSFGGFSSFVLYACVASMAALSFGAEFEARAMPLLLVQPIERARLWRDKMAALWFALLSLAVFAVVTCALADYFTPDPQKVGSFPRLWSGELL